jgi:tripartite-type tricarboxylate transporter receptor subunit TctC
MHHRIAAAFAALALAFTGGAFAQAWPNKAIKWVNPFPAGGGTDAFARPLAAKLTTALGQTVFIENLGGAGGTVGAGSAAKAAPDGYTFFVGAIHHTIAETLYTKLPYNGIEKDFEPVTVIAYVPNVVVVHPKHDFKTLADLIAYAKANPGKLNFGSAGNGTSHHLVGELFKAQSGTSLTHVPYRGAGPLMQDLLAGNVDMAFDGMGTSGPQITGGKLKALAVTSPNALARRPPGAHPHRVGLSGVQGDDLVRRLGDQGYTQADRGPHARRTREGHGDARREGHLGQAGRHRGRPVAGGFRALHPRRDRDLGQGREAGQSQDRPVGPDPWPTST